MSNDKTVREQMIDMGWAEDQIDQQINELMAQSNVTSEMELNKKFGYSEEEARKRRENKDRDAEDALMISLFIFFILYQIVVCIIIVSHRQAEWGVWNIWLGTTLVSIGLSFLVIPLINFLVYKLAEIMRPLSIYPE